MASTLDEAARLASMLANIQDVMSRQSVVPNKKIVGLYTGGTLAAEAAMLLAAYLDLTTDSEHTKGFMLHEDGHEIIDLGDDFYTVGKPHPMIDPSTRMQKIEALASRLDVGVLLVDVVIGYGANADPSESVCQAVNIARSQRGDKEPLIVIATVTGTEADPQNRQQQIQQLEQAGIIVMRTLPEAVMLAKQLVSHVVSSQPLQPYSLLSGVKVINAGLRSFAQDLQATKTPVIHYQWAPIAGGNRYLANLLKKLQ